LATGGRGSLDSGSTLGRSEGYPVSCDSLSGCRDSSSLDISISPSSGCGSLNSRDSLLSGDLSIGDSNSSSGDDDADSNPYVDMLRTSSEIRASNFRPDAHRGGSGNKDAARCSVDSIPCVGSLRSMRATCPA
jgi:hypothetical protein